MMKASRVGRKGLKTECLPTVQQLFAEIQNTINLQLLDTKSYASGVVGLHYHKD
jgi:hypothetical protein